MSSLDICKNNTITYLFIGNENDIRKEYILKYFDTNYIPLNNILISYYRTKNPLNINDNEFLELLYDLNDGNKPYNRYNIYPIAIMVLIIFIILFILILRILLINYYQIYGYILIGIILLIIVIGSIWFLYINNETL